MLEWLNPLPGQKVLDVGSGSGWTTALLAHLVGSKGMIYAVERIPELVKFGSENCKHLNLGNAKFFEAGKDVGLVKHAPYDRILVSAAADQLPYELLQQLKIGGRIVIPIASNVTVIKKIGDDKYETDTHSGFAFVPLI